MSYDGEREDFYTALGNTASTRCTRNMPVDWPTEERIDQIAQNGATGEHYMNKYQRKLTKPTYVQSEDDEDVFIDVYDVLDAFNVSNPATAHAIKKLLCTGIRGAKDWETDLQEAIDSLERAKSFPPIPF